jgi:hypothetical protein
MRRKTIAPALHFALLLVLLPETAGANGNIAFWISQEDHPSFPSSLAGPEGIKKDEAASPPVRTASGDGAADDDLRNRISLGIDMYYANDFEKSESILSAAWDDLQAEKKARSVSARLQAECFAFRMLVLKVQGRNEQALSLALEAGPAVRKDLLDTMDISPDGLAFIKNALGKASPKVYDLTIAVSSRDDLCTIFVDEISCPSPDESIRLTGEAHWIRAECGEAAGWDWRIEMPQLAGKVLHLSPEDESTCDPSGFPVIVCSKLTQGVLDIASNFTAYSGVDGVLLMKPSEKEGLPGFVSAGLPASGDASLADLQWTWKPLPEGLEASPHDAKGKMTGKDKHGRISLALGLTGIAVAGISAGLGAWTLNLKGDSHTVADPWDRQEAELKCESVEGAAISMSVLAVSLIITSIVYYVVSNKKHKGLKSESGTK